SVEYGVNWTNIVCSELNFDISNIVLNDKSTRFKVERLSLHEKSGLNIKNISGDIVLKYGIMDVYDCNLVLDKSRVHLSTFQFSWPNDEHAWRYFTSKVMQFYNVRKADVSFEDLAYFNGELLGIKTRMQFDGLLYGTIDNFKGRDLRVKIAKKSTLLCKFESWGLPDTFGTIFDIDIKDANLNPEDIASVYLPWFDMNIPVPNVLRNFNLIHFNKLAFNGLLENFVLDAETDSPELSSEFHMDYSPDTLRPKMQSNFKGEYFCTAIDLGLLLRVNSMSYTYGNGSFSGYVNDENISFKTKGLLNSFQFNKDVINNIVYDYSLNNNDWEANVLVDDEGLKFAIGLNNKNLLDKEYVLGRGMIDIDSISQFNFINKSFFKQLESDGGELKSDYDFSFSDDFKNFSFKINKLYYKNNRGDFYLNDIYFDAANFGEDSCKISFNSDFLVANIGGDISKLKYAEFLAILFSSYIPSYVSSSVGINDEDWSCHLNFIDINKILKVIYPDIYVSGGTTLDILYDRRVNNIEVLFEAEKFKYKDLELTTSKINLLGDGSILNSTVSMSKFLYKDFVLHNIINKSIMKSDSLKNNLSWANSDGRTYCGDFFMKVAFYKEKDNRAMNVDISPSIIIIGDTIWNFEKSSINIVGKEVAFSDMSFSSENKYFMLKGGMSEKDGRALDFFVNQISIKGVNKLSFTEKLNSFDLLGVLTGRTSIFNIYNKRKVLANFLLKDCSINKDYFGDFEFVSQMDSGNELMKIQADNKMGGLKPISIEGVYNTYMDSLNVKLDLRNLNIYKLRKYIGKYVSKTRGNITGELNFKGNILKPRINGYIKMDSVSVMVNALQNYFFINDSLYVSNDNLYLKNFLIEDLNNGSLRCSGAYNIWNDVFNLDFVLDDFYVMNTRLVDN
ncbi:MAG: hypothetical protein WCS56_05840, partial [Bacilli bacterium]